MLKTAARNDWIRNNNTKLIRNLVREHGQISKAELARISKLTFPTVSQAVNDLLELNEIAGIAGKSSGGRPGNVYFINPKFRYYFCAILSIEKFMVQVNDYCGTKVMERCMPVTEQLTVEDIIDFLEAIKQEYPLLLNGIIGVAGISVDGEIKHFPYCRKLENVNIRDKIYEKLAIEVVLENDVNAIAMGESHLFDDFAHVIWTRGCIGSAIVLNNRVLSGAHGCAGEVEYACHNLEDRYACLKDAMMAIYSVVDVPTIVFSGKEITKDDMKNLKDYLEELLPEFRRPTLIYAEDEDRLYLKGLHHLMLGLFEEL
ncbi:MAG: ROK family protein [bacterium]|nr:ROK family protein [bacterium]